MYVFIALAFELASGHSIIVLDHTREVIHHQGASLSKQHIVCNLIFCHGTQTMQSSRSDSKHVQQNKNGALMQSQLIMHSMILLAIQYLSWEAC